MFVYLQVELIDLTNNYKYEAHCNCIFTNNVRERTLFVNQVPNLTVSQGGDGANKKIKMKYFSSASVFVLVLFIAVIVCVFNFLYFYKKWRLNNSGECNLVMFVLLCSQKNNNQLILLSCSFKVNQPNNRLSLNEIAQRRNSGANNNQDLDSDRNDDLTKTKMLSVDKPPPYAGLYSIFSPKILKISVNKKIFQTETNHFTFILFYLKICIHHKHTWNQSYRHRKTGDFH